jgi:hypothetical protein
MSPQSNGDRRVVSASAFCHLRCQTARRLTGKAETEEGENGVGNIVREASGNKIT